MKDKPDYIQRSLWEVGSRSRISTLQKLLTYKLNDVYSHQHASSSEVSAECRPTIGQPLSIDISTDMSVECQWTYRATHFDRHIDRHSADMSTDTSVDCRSICRPMHRSRGASVKPKYCCGVEGELLVSASFIQFQWQVTKRKAKRLRLIS